MSRSVGFSRRLLLSIDARGYGSRTDSGQAILQGSLPSVLDAAAGRAGLDRAAWERQVAGDGEVCVLPPSEPEPRVVDDFMRELAAELEYYNESRVPAFHLRLRAAIHFGAAMPAEMGYTGQGMVQVNRLVDCAPVRSLLQDERVCLAVIMSDNVFQDIVAQGHTSLRVKDFKEVTVVNKEYAKRAWVRAPGWDVHALPVTGEPVTPAPGPGPADAAAPGPGPANAAAPARGPENAAAHAKPAATVHTEIHGGLRAEQVNIGYIGGGA